MRGAFAFAAFSLVLACAFAARARADAGFPESPGREDVQAGIAKIKPAIADCGTKFSSVKGVVKVTFHIAPSGAVADATVKQAPDPALGACVAAAVKTARFPASEHGTAVSYPFVFK